MKKIIRLGFLKGTGNVFCKIDFENGRLSISGVEGPLKSGNCKGGCGQIDMHMREGDYLDKMESATGWDRAKIDRFLEIWKRWHLNDMRPGCVHQREIDMTREVEIVTYKLTHEAQRMRDEAVKYAAKESAAGRPVNLSEQARALVLLEDWYADRFSPPDADGLFSGCYEVKKREQKAIGWVLQSEHPDGMLSRPCPMCGYKYGNAWLREEVPADVIEWLGALPNTDIIPAWV